MGTVLLDSEASASNVGHPAHLVRAVVLGAAALARMMRDARARRRLASADDETLKDLGISRTQAHFEASRPFWR